MSAPGRGDAAGEDADDRSAVTRTSVLSSRAAKSSDADGVELQDLSDGPLGVHGAGLLVDVGPSTSREKANRPRSSSGVSAEVSSAALDTYVNLALPLRAGSTAPAAPALQTTAQ